MTEATAIASFRRVSPAILASARMAMANDIPDTSKSEISLLLKKAAPILGIDGTTYHVLDILLGLSRGDDWKGVKAGRSLQFRTPSSQNTRCAPSARLRGACAGSLKLGSLPTETAQRA